MSLDDPPPRFAPGGSPVTRCNATLPGVAARDGSPILLPFVRWALWLNVGDLLAASPAVDVDGAWRFQSYEDRVWSSATACLQPWPFVEELLRRPLAAVGRDGVLWLAEEAEALLGGQLLLRVEVDAQLRELTLEPWAAGRRLDLETRLEASYVLPILPGFQVMLPEDLLWVLDLERGDTLAYEIRLIVAKYVPWDARTPPEGYSLITLGPGGLLALPDALRIPSALQLNAKVRLRVTFWEGVILEVRPWAQVE